MVLHLNTPAPLLAKISTVLNNLPPNAGFSPQAKPVVGISGGPDSTALLVALHLFSRQTGFKFEACHVNHKLRKDESEQDEQFCKMLCEKLSIPLTVFSASAEDADLNAAEASLRATRYDFLFRCAESSATRFVMLGHTANDQVETVLFRFLRGTSPTGLTGIRFAHQMRNGIWLLRPMLACSRDEINEFLEQCGISARQDSSNHSSKYSRNFLRNQVIPLCETRFPSMMRQIERLRESIVIDEDYLDLCTEEFLAKLGRVDSGEWDAALLGAAHPALQRRALARAFECRSIEVSFERVEAVLNMMANPFSSEHRISLNHRWDASLSSNRLSWIDKESIPYEVNFGPVNLKVPGKTMLLQRGQVFRAELWTGAVPEKFPERTEMEAVVDLSCIVGQLVIRESAANDRITPLGMTQSVNLKKYLRTHRAAKPIRLQTTVIADDNEVLWVPGVGMSETIRVRAKPTHHLSLSAISADFTPA